MELRRYKFTDEATADTQLAGLLGVSSIYRLGVKTIYDVELHDSTTGSEYHVDVIYQVSVDTAIDAYLIWPETPKTNHGADAEASYVAAMPA